MTRQAHASRIAALAIAITGGSACTTYEGTPVVMGTLERVEGIEITRDFLLMRAVPDHPDGFEVARDYHGPLFFADGCPTEHLQFPFEYALWGDQNDVDETDGVPWRVLVWETDDPEAHWVQPGEAYGTVAFSFADDPYGSWAYDVDVAIAGIAR